MVNQGTGNIAYSFNKNSLYNIIEGNKTLFILNYILVIFISTFFLTGSFFMTGLSIDRYITPNDENSQNSQNSQNGQIGQNLVKELPGILTAEDLVNYKGQAHGMFSRIFRIHIYKFFLPNIM